jgi:hypothetical protein
MCSLVSSTNAEPVATRNTPLLAMVRAGAVRGPASGGNGLTMPPRRPPNCPESAAGVAAMAIKAITAELPAPLRISL